MINFNSNESVMRRYMLFGLIVTAIAAIVLLIATAYQFIMSPTTSTDVSTTNEVVVISDAEKAVVELGRKIETSKEVEISDAALKPNAAEVGDVDGLVAELNDVFSEEPNDLQKVSVSFEAIKPSENESRILYEAEETLIKECMNERGFEYNFTPADVESNRNAQHELSEQGGITAAREKENGYGLADLLNHSTEMEFETTDADRQGEMLSPNTAHVDSLNPDQQQAWRTALMGSFSSDLTLQSESLASVEDSNSGGFKTWDVESCLAIAQAQLYQSNVIKAENEFSADALQSQLHSLAKEDTEYQSTLGQWKNCMAERGEYFEHPGETVEHLLYEYNAGNIDIAELREQEIKISSVDRECHQHTSLGQAYREALQRTETILLNDNPEAVVALRQAIDSAVEQALTVTR